MSAFRASAFPLPLRAGLILLLLTLLPSILSLHCYECFDSIRPCTRFNNCTGSACILYENMPNRSSVSFCLLVSPVAQQKDADLVQGCWKDEGTSGVECLCTDEFCNLPRDQWASDPNSPPVFGLRMLQRNPLVDYEYLDDERAASLGVDGPQSRAKESQQKVEEDKDIVEDPEMTEQYIGHDLMPVELSDYFDWERRFRHPNKSNNLRGKAQDGTSSVSQPIEPSSTELPIPINLGKNATTDPLEYLVNGSISILTGFVCLPSIVLCVISLSTGDKCPEVLLWAVHFPPILPSTVSSFPFSRQLFLSSPFHSSPRQALTRPSLIPMPTTRPPLYSKELQIRCFGGAQTEEEQEKEGKEEEGKEEEGKEEEGKEDEGKDEEEEEENSRRMGARTRRRNGGKRGRGKEVASSTGIRSLEKCDEN
uniref:Uncharacterized protein n=1 Tax=Globodera rostochiensis TaxID=31243 RepID=A0A914HDB7_GLORO